MGFIRRFLLPREVDFDAAMLEQARVAREMVERLYQLCSEENEEALAAIAEQAGEARRLQDRNMKELLDVFITPYDKESIYRMITQLDWIALSVKHFQLEVEVYRVPSFPGHEGIVSLLREMARTLETGIAQLGKVPLPVMGREIDRIRDLYDEVVSHCARASGGLDPALGCKALLLQRDMLMQLKEIARRIHVAANTLQDMAIKVV
ncbi:MAG TPA: hypothetical protein ENJ98_02990 [Thiolapillus brandeum]|uniref:DUF47 family protein n=1 Tax=Thiolapillus brandeum TaxID=1076588 RepID=A0A7C5MZK3_9GAMM|nr:hypothetical protein [Thiolapillus brandeum]